jgi:MFS family permease
MNASRLQGGVLASDDFAARTWFFLLAFEAAVSQTSRGVWMPAIMNACDKSGSQRVPAALRSSLRLITAAGCLAMVFFVGSSCPAFVQFMRELGATDAHFGLLGGIPMIMLALQFLGAAITNVIPRRKALFMILVILGRFLYIPMAVIPACMPGLRGQVGVWYVICLIALAGAVLNIAGPLWLSWMADLIPRRILNTYWGRRQRWMYLTWTAAFLAVAGVTAVTDLSMMIVFPIIATLGALAGIVDMVLFVWVHEPKNTVMRGQPVLGTMLAPFHHAAYRPFVVFSCAWSAVAMFAAAFMQIYALKGLGLPVATTTLIWCASGVGIALVSSTWGKMADRHGHRPILTICIGMKSIVVLVFLLVTPTTALWLLPVTFFVDSFWNAGTMVASNGYMLKIAPQENRSMFIAAITGFAGICGGLGAMLGGLFLDLTSSFAWERFGRVWTHYHLLFLLSIGLRLGCIVLAYRVKEPLATTPEKLLYLVRGTWPMRFLLFPVGLYRRGKDAIPDP